MLGGERGYAVRMLRATFLVLASAAATASVLPHVAPGAGAAAEPPLRIDVQIDGTTVELVDGERQEVTVGERKVTVRATVQATCLLVLDGFRLQFPRAMAFALDESPHHQTWTLDGGDCTLLVHRFPAGSAPDALEHAAGIAKVIAEATERDAGAAARLEWRFGAHKLAGASVPIEVVGTRQRNTVFVFRTPTGDYVLVIQDTLGDDGELSAESRGVHEVLRSTVTWQAR